MDEHEMYEVQLEDSGERLEKKEQLRAKVQALVSYYEDEKRRNEELTMELERLKAEQQQMQSITGQAPGMAPAPGMSPPPAMNPAPGGIPFAQRPQNGFQPQQGFPPPGMPGGAPEFQPPPQAPGGYTLQSFGAQPPQAPQQPGFGAGFAPQPPRPPMPQNPYGAPAPWQQPNGMPPQPPQSPYGAPAPWQQQPAQPFGQFPQNPYAAPAPWQQQPPQAPAYPQQNDALTESVGLVLQTITQVRAKLHQSESIRGYGYPQQPLMDADTVALLDKLYDQLGDLSRELMQRQAR